jgi:hypothetical protein
MNDYGWWGRKVVIDGKETMEWIGPMSKGHMMDCYDEYRHYFSKDKPE